MILPPISPPIVIYACSQVSLTLRLTLAHLYHKHMHALYAHSLIHTHVLILDVDTDADVNSDVLHMSRPAELGRGRGRQLSWTSSEIGTLDSAVSG